jgi:hypothetical protein
MKAIMTCSNIPLAIKEPCQPPCSCTGLLPLVFCGEVSRKEIRRLGMSSGLQRQQLPGAQAARLLLGETLPVVLLLASHTVFDSPQVMFGLIGSLSDLDGNCPAAPSLELTNQ